VNSVLYLYVWSGDAKRALQIVSGRYPGLPVEEFPHRRLRESNFFGRLALLRAFRGRSLIFFVESLDEFKHRKLIECVHLLHRSPETVLCDSNGRWDSWHKVDVLRLLPGIACGIFLDGMTLAGWWFSLKLRLLSTSPLDTGIDRPNPEVAYILPSFTSMGSSGGAISHIRGVLYGLKKRGSSCRVFTGVSLAQNAFANEMIPVSGRAHMFWEAGMLAYNRSFFAGVHRHLATSTPGVLYQRHCPFAIAGAMLSKRCRIPLILEYNGPQGWMTDHWDPTPFRRWIVLCEEVTLRAAARIVVVSEVLKAELMGRGIPADRIRVNPNAVDPDFFSPGPGRYSGRKKLGVSAEEILIGFAGSFSLWHGMEVLEQAIAKLFSRPQPCRLRFVLMGHGLLHGQMRSALTAHEVSGAVHFTGSIASEQVVEYLDACDILVSPHISMPDGSRFFGSPTKIFEYMAMGKAIVASRLEQLAEVLEDDRTACLVTPGSVDELAGAILRLALDPGKREQLGRAARQQAIANHSWVRNVTWALSDLRPPARPNVAGMQPAGGPSGLR
jgi:glycosyltransferase involved in cell wall biosynthesis